MQLPTGEFFNNDRRKSICSIGHGSIKDRPNNRQFLSTFHKATHWPIYSLGQKAELGMYVYESTICSGLTGWF